jgi:virulence-associated protein VagC
MSKSRPLCKGVPTWTKNDQPVAVRAPASFLFGLRKVLISVGWDYPPRCVRVDDVAGTMEVAGAKVLQVTCEENELKLNWLKDEWMQWQELQNDEDFKELKTKWNDILKSVRDKQSKGAGKGPTKGSAESR